MNRSHSKDAVKFGAMLTPCEGHGMHGIPKEAREFERIDDTLKSASIYIENRSKRLFLVRAIES
jgi:hypothetical protein